MTRFVAIILAATATAVLAGCTTFQRNDGVTSYAGEAIAANTVMQMVDPWPAGVEDTDLETPAERPTQDQATAAAALTEDPSEVGTRTAEY